MRSRFATLALVAVLAAPGAAHAAKKGKTGPTPKPPATRVTTGPEAAMVAVRDAETGQLRAPTAEEYRKLMSLDAAGTLRAAPRSAEIVVNPDGSKTARLTGYESYEIAKKRPDGSVDRRCFADPVAAGIFLRGGDPSQPVAEK